VVVVDRLEAVVVREQDADAAAQAPGLGGCRRGLAGDYASERVTESSSFFIFAHLGDCAREATAVLPRLPSGCGSTS
jgi:hypothetical protein